MSERISCDTVVLGGGTSGCVVAGRLAAESEQEVVLVEAGPDYGSLASGAWPADLLDAGSLATSHDWGYDSGDVHPGREPIPLARARVLGGCSSHNGCIAAVGCAEDYDAWAAVSDDSWGITALRPLFQRALERLRVRTYTDEEIGPFHRAALEAALALGIPRGDDLDDLDGGVGFGAEPANVDNGVRFNAAFAYLDPARSRANLRIVDRTLIESVREQSGRVEVLAWRDGAAVTIEARTAVLSAGAYGSPAILLRSGVGDPDQLEPLGIRAVVALPGVGRNLHDHPLVELEFAGSEALREALAASAAVRFTPEEQTLGKLRSAHATGPYDLHLFPVAGLEGSVFAGQVLIVVSAMEPRSRGALTLRGADPTLDPVIDHGYLTDPDGLDMAVLLEGMERARELAATEPLCSLAGVEVGSFAAEPEAEVRRLHTHYFHPVGTCAMGEEHDPLAVCDARGRVRGFEQLVVADCSLMPVVPRANTNLPAAVVGERIADELLATGR